MYRWVHRGDYMLVDCAVVGTRGDVMSAGAAVRSWIAVRRAVRCVCICVLTRIYAYT